jgi:cytochrome c-type biogenesis protein CcmH/NrfG
MTVLSSLASSYHYGPATTSTTLWDISKSYIAEFGKRLKNIQNLQRQQAEEMFFQKKNLLILEQKLKLQQEELQHKLLQNDPKSGEKIEFSTQSIETLRAIENMTQPPQQSSSSVYTILLAAITAIITGIIIVFSNSNSNQVQRQQQQQLQPQQLQPQQLQQQQQQQFTSPRLARSGLHTQTPHTRQYYNYSEN